MASPKNKFSKPPRKGTKARNVLLLMLKPEGFARNDIEDEPHNLTTLIATLRDDKGYDIRKFPKRKSDKGRAKSVYRCIGKMRWDGSYRSFTERYKE